MRGEAQSDAEPWQKGGAWFDFELDETTGERITDLFGDIAGTRMGRIKGAAATSLRMKGQDVAETLRVTVREARDGVVRLVTSMTGITVAVDVPAGTRDGALIKLDGFGIEGFGGGDHGDLNVRIQIVPDPAIGEE
jgi:curved DNA-binding protein